MVDLFMEIEIVSLFETKLTSNVHYHFVNLCEISMPVEMSVDCNVHVLNHFRYRSSKRK